MKKKLNDIIIAITLLFYIFSIYCLLKNETYSTIDRLIFLYLIINGFYWFYKAKISK